MVNKVFKITALGLLMSMGMSSASHAQFEVDGASRKVEIESIPFVVALRKIVPVSYDFSFETNADLGQVVSYEYRENWEATLKGLLDNMELSYRLLDGIVYVSEKVQENLIAEVPAAPVMPEAPVNTVSSKMEIPSIGSYEKMSAPKNNNAQQAISAPEEERYIWQVKKGYTLQETMKSWGKQVDWNVVWDTDKDFEIQSEVSFSGSFVDAASSLIDAFSEADPGVVGTFYKNNTLVIKTTSNGEVN